MYTEPRAARLLELKFDYRGPVILDVRRISGVRMTETGKSRTTCPSCSKSIVFPVSKCGATIRCPNCGGQLKLPSSPPPASIPTPPTNPNNQTPRENNTVRNVGIIAAVLSGLLILSCGGCFALSLFLMPSPEQLEEMRQRADARRAEDQAKFDSNLLKSKSLGFAEDYFFSPNSHDLNRMLKGMGAELVFMHDCDEFRRWESNSKGTLVLTGPKQSITGIFLRTAYSSDEASNLLSTALVFHILGTALNPNVGSGQQSVQLNQAIKFLTENQSKRKSGELQVGEFTINRIERFPDGQGFDIAIVPSDTQINIRDVFRQCMPD